MGGPLLRRISDGRTAPRDQRLGSRGYGEAALRRVAVHPACRIVRLSRSLGPDFREPGTVHCEVRPRDRPRALRIQGPGGQGPALRPELTASILRFYVSSLRSLPKPLKLYTAGN